MTIRSFRPGLLTAAAAALLFCLPVPLTRAQTHDEAHTPKLPRVKVAPLAPPALAPTTPPPAAVKPAKPLAAVAAGSVLISEFRVSGPLGPEDEFIELYNNTDQDINMAGWSIAKTDVNCGNSPITVAVITVNPIIRARRHYLLAGMTYSLGNYPAGNSGVTAVPDQTYTEQIEPGRSIGLFNTSVPLEYSNLTRVDAVGLGTGAGGYCTTLSEGTRLPRAAGTSQYSFVRRMERATNGLPQDTDDNAADFVLISTTPGQTVGDSTVRVLGAPGPENSASPVVRNSVITVSLLDPTVGATALPNLERRAGVETCSPFGSMLFRRRYTNDTGGLVTKLRFRVVEITTVNSPQVFANQAQLRVRNSPDEFVRLSSGELVAVQGLTREQPPSQPAPRCGGLNTSLSPGGVGLLNPLGPGESIEVQFRVGINRHGSFRFYVNVEALP